MGGSEGVPSDFFKWAPSTLLASPIAEI